MLPHLSARDVAFACVSIAPHEKLLAFKKRMGWRFDWHSSAGTSFNEDFGVAFAGGRSGIYNFDKMVEGVGERPDLSVFAKNDGGIYLLSRSVRMLVAMPSPAKRKSLKALASSNMRSCKISNDQGSPSMSSVMPIGQADLGDSLLCPIAAAKLNFDSAVSGDAVRNEVVHRYMAPGNATISENGLALIDKIQNRPDHQRNTACIDDNLLLHSGRPKAMHCRSFTQMDACTLGTNPVI